MPRRDRSRMVLLYHTYVAILLLLGGVALLTMGVKLGTGQEDPFHLNYASDTLFNNSQYIYLVCIGVGGFVMVSGAASLFSFGLQARGRSFRLLYVDMAFVTLVMLVATAIATWLSVQIADNGKADKFV